MFCRQHLNKDHWKTLACMAGLWFLHWLTWFYFLSWRMFCRQHLNKDHWKTLACMAEHGWSLVFALTDVILFLELKDVLQAAPEQRPLKNIGLHGWAWLVFGFCADWRDFISWVEGCFVGSTWTKTTEKHWPAWLVFGFCTDWRDFISWVEGCFAGSTWTKTTEKHWPAWLSMAGLWFLRWLTWFYFLSWRMFCRQHLNKDRWKNLSDHTELSLWSTWFYATHWAWPFSEYCRNDERATPHFYATTSTYDNRSIHFTVTPRFCTEHCHNTSISTRTRREATPFEFCIDSFSCYHI